MSTVGERVALMLRTCSMTQLEFAQGVGIKPQTLTKILSGVMVGSLHMTRMAKVLKVNEAWLSTGEKEPAWIRRLITSCERDARTMAGEQLEALKAAYLAGSKKRSLLEHLRSHGLREWTDGELSAMVEKPQAWAVEASINDVYRVFESTQQRPERLFYLTRPFMRDRWADAMPEVLPDPVEVPKAEAIRDFDYMGSITSQSEFSRDRVTEAKDIRIRPGYSLIRVDDWSAFPVVFPGQYVLCDKTANPEHRNLVACFSQNDEGQERVAIYRYLKDANSSCGFILATINNAVNVFIPGKPVRLLPIAGVIFPEAIDGIDLEDAREAMRHCPFGEYV